MSGRWQGEAWPSCWGSQYSHKNIYIVLYSHIISYIYNYILILYIDIDDIPAKSNKQDASINNSNSNDDRNNNGNNNVNPYCIEYIEELMIISDDK